MKKKVEAGLLKKIKKIKIKSIYIGFNETGLHINFKWNVIDVPKMIFM